MSKTTLQNYIFFYFLANSDQSAGYSHGAEGGAVARRREDREGGGEGELKDIEGAVRILVAHAFQHQRLEGAAALEAGEARQGMARQLDDIDYAVGVGRGGCLGGGARQHLVGKGDADGGARR